MSAPITTIHVSPDDLYAAAAELGECGRVEWVDQGGETVVLTLPTNDGDD